jgi:hypothetical protein
VSGAKKIAGTWYNQHGSELALNVDPEGVVRGRFRSAVGLAMRDEAFPVTGFCSGELIAFTVDFSGHDSITSWVGHYLDQGGDPRLETLWQMVVHVSTRGAQAHQWRGVHAGADLFTRTRGAPLASHLMPSHPTGYRR